MSGTLRIQAAWNALPAASSPPSLPLPRPARRLQYRWHVFKSIRQAIDDNEGGLDKFTQGAPLAGGLSWGGGSGLGAFM